MSLRLSFTLSRSLALSLSFVGLVGLAPAARAETGPPPPVVAVLPPAERVNSINISPLGVLFGTYNINYERLWGSHGLVVELGLARLSDDGDDATSLGSSFGYRWHWRGRQDSGFLGLAAGVYDGTGEASVDIDGSEETHDVDVRSYYLVANIGKRWAFRNGFNITLRAGGGYGHYDIEARSDDPAARQAADEVNDLLTRYPIAIDGELSVGYTF